MIGDELETSTLTLSPPHDGSEFELFPELQSSGMDLCDCSVKLTDCCTSAELSKSGVTLNANPRSVIRVKMTSSEEADFVNYLTGKKQDEDTPCIQVVRDLNNFPSYKPTLDTTSNGSAHSTTENENTDNTRRSCMSKNAIMAREHRLRKKMYHETLQTTNNNLTAENGNLKTKVVHLKSTVAGLEQEVTYLKSVIANQGAISALLKNIHNTAGLHFNSGLTPTADQSCASTNAIVSANASGKRKLGPDANTIDAPSKRGPSAGGNMHNDTDLNSNEVASDDAAGVCLHVKAGKVSLEFCADCSEKSEASWNKNNVLL